MQSCSIISLSPSFNSYNNNKLPEIAARVVEEFDSEESYEEFYFETLGNDSDSAEKEITRHDANSAADADSDGEFEFPFLTKDVFRLSSPVSADEIFQNGHIRPVYPVFNRDLLLRHVEIGNQNSVPDSGPSNGARIRLPLRKLFNEERETALTTSSSSSEEADELVGVPEEMYCVWMPKESPAEGRCKKSGSAGSNSKRWKFRDLLYRSHSDGSKGSFVF